MFWIFIILRIKNDYDNGEWPAEKHNICNEDRFQYIRTRSQSVFFHWSPAKRGFLLVSWETKLDEVENKYKSVGESNVRKLWIITSAGTF